MSWKVIQVISMSYSWMKMSHSAIKLSSSPQDEWPSWVNHSPNLKTSWYPAFIYYKQNCCEQACTGSCMKAFAFLCPVSLSERKGAFWHLGSWQVASWSGHTTGERHHSSEFPSALGAFSAQGTLIGVWWWQYLIVALACVCLKASDAVRLSVGLFSICVSKRFDATSLRSSHCFLVGLPVAYNWVLRVLYIF